ncbi:MAG TPA: gluconate:H+ symporter [Burkholderiaceae bacterium]
MAAPDVPASAASVAGAASAVASSAAGLGAHDERVLLVAALGIALLVLLIVWLRLHAFLALTIGALFVGVGSGLPLDKITASYENGVGGVLGYVGVLIALGAMLGKLLADSGGADKVVDTLLRGREATLPWKMAAVAAIIGIPMFFEIGLVLLIPVVMLAVHRSKGPAMRLGIPALAGLSVLHGFIPPHPGPLAAISILHADVGLTLALGVVVAIPTVIVAGPLFGILAARLVPVGAAGAGLAVAGGQGGDAATRPPHSPGFGTTLATLASPIVLMLAKAGADIWLAKGNGLRVVLDFVGDPVFALLVAVLLAMVTFGTALGVSIEAVGKTLSASLAPVVGVMLIVGAGGGFKQALVDGGAGAAIAKLALAAGIPVLVLGWAVAALIRLATGSATVAIVTAAGIVAPLAAGLAPAHLSLLVLSVGAGSLIFSHVNDAGFWLVKEYFGLSVGETLKTWSLMETVIAAMGLAVVLALSVAV